MVRVRNLVLAIAAASALTSEAAYAVGLGAVTLKSALNQPLVAEIELLDAKSLSPGEVVPVLASAEDFNRAGVDRPYFLADLKFTPVLRPDGKSVIQVSSSKPVREPYLNFLVELFGRAVVCCVSTPCCLILPCTHPKPQPLWLLSYLSLRLWRGLR